MANTKKLRSEKKVTLSVSIKQGNLDDFRYYCDKLGVVPSHKAEELIVAFNESIKPF